ncbi:MAG: response regulator transcription factor [Chloroflexi bacterium]|nr:response regulator transcription factor [Chloroflexota bacterium]
MTTIRVLLADDHAVIRDALSLLLNTQADITIVGKAEDGRQAVALARELRPDVAVLDISMPHIDGLQAAQLIRTEAPYTQVLILTMHENDAYFFRALEAGAAGYVFKKAASEELLQAIRSVAQGNAYFPPSMARKLLEGYLNGTKGSVIAGPPGYDTLSDREKEIMFLLIQGQTNQVIAEKLVITPSTVQAHRTHIMQKLNLETTIDLVRYAIRFGLIEP